VLHNTLRHTTLVRTHPWISDQPKAETGIHVCAGFEPAITTSERPQNDILDTAATGIGSIYRVSIMSFPDYKHLLKESYVE
jgi:hypothetical protein